MVRKTDVQIAKEVIEGKWGIGASRKTLITRAGYDYETIQKYVNRILSTGLPIKEVTVNAKNCSGVVVYLEV